MGQNNYVHLTIFFYFISGGDSWDEGERKRERLKEGREKRGGRKEGEDYM